MYTMYFNQIHSLTISIQLLSQILCSFKFLTNNLLSSVRVDHMCMAVIPSTGVLGNLGDYPPQEK